MGRYVIYSALVGGYDQILQPLVVDERFDYILFTNDINRPKVGVWQILPIQYENKDNTRICRYVKTHPDILLPDYSVSVWMDASIQIISKQFYDRILELDKDNILISSMWHSERQCIYDEAFAVMKMMVEHERVVVDWCHYLRKEKYPRENGLCETGVMYRKHNQSSVQRVDAVWWKCIEDYSRRDQLSFNYSLWKVSLPCHFFWGKCHNVRNTEHLRLVSHKDIRHNHCQIKKNEAWLMRHCWKHAEDTDKVERIYDRLYSWPFPLFWIAIVGQYYRLIDRLK